MAVSELEKNAESSNKTNRALNKAQMGMSSKEFNASVQNERALSPQGQGWCQALIK